MSSPCVLPLTPAATQARMLKRSRGAAGEDAPTSKACKQSPTASPQKAVTAAASVPADMNPAASAVPATSAAAVAAALEAEDPMSPFLLACNNIRYAITFIQNSRRHALALCLQNQWERALAVLEKIERANDKISRQRRRTVLQQANSDAAERAASDLLSPAATNEGKPLTKKRSVRFSDDVTVGEAEALDRSPAPMPMLLRDEILVLRASRPIPAQNFSEFWG